jgi:gamma-glutamyltranspeptidase/glutathione hydrolase
VAAFVAEPLLCSAGGGGIMTVALPNTAPAVIDFFSDAPGLGGAIPETLDFAAVEVDFGTVIQEFHVGRGSAAVPGVLPGLAAAHQRFGTLPLSQLVSAAQVMARDGIECTAETAYTYSLLWPIIQMHAETMAVMSPGRAPVVGDRLDNPELADLLDQFASLGASPPSFLDSVVDNFGPGRGGFISREDVESYQVRFSEPTIVDVGDWRVCTSPAVGGQLVASIVQQLAADPDDHSIMAFARASRAATERRNALIAPGSTTHISVVDTNGGAAALTLTNGEGCGYLVPGTGVHLNNFLGEEDLNPHGFHHHPAGARIPTMIAPTVALRDGVPALALGSGGSNRIRSSVSQVLYRVIAGGESLEHAVRAPRVHAEGDVVWVETEGLADSQSVLDALEREFRQVHEFGSRAFFFGGVHAVELDADGRPVGVGDSRRGGAAVGAT